MQQKRLCPACEVWWWADVPNTTDCPKCGIDGFFTMNASDMGTAIYFEQSGKSLHAFRQVSHEALGYTP